MKFKLGFIFICLIICLFSIASVCAGDVNEIVGANEIDENGKMIASEEQVEKRVAGFQNDAEKANEYDYVVINDDLNKACFDVESIYNAEMQKHSKNNNIDYIKNVLLEKNGLFKK